MQELELEVIATGFDRANNVRAIEAQQLQALLDKQANLLLLDIRTPEEQAISYLPGAVFLSPHANPWKRKEIQTFLKQVRSASALSQTNTSYIVFYCALGARSAQSMRRFVDEAPSHGLSLWEDGSAASSSPVEVRNLHGGVFAWANAGYLLLDAKTGKPTRRVHGYNTKWARFVHPPAQAVLPDFDFLQDARKKTLRNE